MGDICLLDLGGVGGVTGFSIFSIVFSYFSIIFSSRFVFLYGNLGFTSYVGFLVTNLKVLNFSFSIRGSSSTFFTGAGISVYELIIDSILVYLLSNFLPITSFLKFDSERPTICQYYSKHSFALNCPISKAT